MFWLSNFPDIAFVLEDNILYKCDDEEVSVCPMDQLDSSLVQVSLSLIFEPFTAALMVIFTN